MRNEIGRGQLVKYLKPDVNSLFLAHGKRSSQKGSVMYNVMKTETERVAKFRSISILSWSFTSIVLSIVLMEVIIWVMSAGTSICQVLLPCSTCWVFSFSSSEIISKQHLIRMFLHTLTMFLLLSLQLH